MIVFAGLLSRWELCAKSLLPQQSDISLREVLVVYGGAFLYSNRRSVFLIDFHFRYSWNIGWVY